MHLLIGALGKAPVPRCSLFTHLIPHSFTCPSIKEFWVCLCCPEVPSVVMAATCPGQGSVLFTGAVCGEQVEPPAGKGGWSHTLKLFFLLLTSNTSWIYCLRLFELFLSKDLACFPQIISICYSVRFIVGNALLGLLKLAGIISNVLGTGERMGVVGAKAKEQEPHAYVTVSDPQGESSWLCGQHRPI